MRFQPMRLLRKKAAVVKKLIYPKTKGLKAINISLSSLCDADCVYCPSSRGRKISEKIMSLYCVNRIIDEIVSDEFKRYHNIKSMEVGENGDAFLNENLIEILRLIKSKAPHIKLSIFTTFNRLDEEKARIILKEDLIDYFACNIDGSTNEAYFNTKKIELEKVWHNLENFLHMRKLLNKNAPLTIMVLTLHSYMSAVYKNFGFHGSKLNGRHLNEVIDDFALIKKRCEEILDPLKDRVIKAGIIGWAERCKAALNKIDYKRYFCPNLIRLKNEAFIAPDGSWYACCYDSDNELVLGNIMERSINDIFFSSERIRLIKLLEERRFAEVGGPCRTVNCCQEIS